MSTIHAETVWKSWIRTEKRSTIITGRTSLSAGPGTAGMRPTITTGREIFWKQRGQKEIPCSPTMCSTGRRQSPCRTAGGWRTGMMQKACAPGPWRTAWKPGFCILTESCCQSWMKREIPSAVISWAMEPRPYGTEERRDTIPVTWMSRTALLTSQDWTGRSKTVISMMPSAICRTGT